MQNPSAFGRYSLQTRIASLWLQLIWTSPLNPWPVFEWSCIFILFVRQSFKGVFYLFLYFFLVQGINGPMNKTDILHYDTIFGSDLEKW